MFFWWEFQVFKNIKSVFVFKLLGYGILVIVFVVYFLSFPIFVSSCIFLGGWRGVSFVHSEH